MLKVVMGSILISLFSSNSFAENCMVSDPLKNKTCSAEYFRARNQRELDDYLLSGRFKDGKLLNLKVDFNIKEKEINIATSCDLKISRERGLFAKQNGVCLKGLTVHLEGENELVADKNAPIDISAANSVVIRKSSLETKGKLSISTSSFIPLNGEILISRESILKARSIHINSKSNLIINSESKLKSDEIILDGGNCEINEKNDRDNDDEREHERECKKFKPQFSYTGTCTSNPLPTNLKITSTVNASNSQSINFSVSGAPSSSAIIWKFDQAFESIDARARQDFMYPGRHLAQAVVVASNGYFRKIGQYLNVAPARFNKGQIAIFQFVGSNNAPKKIYAAIDMRKVTLIKSDQDPELYFTEITSDKAGVSNMLIPYFNYQGKFSLVLMPLISSPRDYIEQFFNQIKNINNLGDVNFKDNGINSINAIVDALYIKINAMDEALIFPC